MTLERPNHLSNVIITITTLIFAITSLITVFISISAWRDERESVRPYLTFHSSPNVYFVEDKQLVFSFKFSNVGPHPAASLHSQTVIVDYQLNISPLHTDQYSLVNFIAQNTTTDLIIKIDREASGINTQEITPHFIIISLKYTDPVLEINHEQIIYLRWPGIVDGKISPIFHASKEEKDRIVAYFQK